MRQYTVKYGDEILEDIAELYGFYLDLVDEMSAERFRQAASETIDSLAAVAAFHELENPDKYIEMIKKGLGS